MRYRGAYRVLKAYQQWRRGEGAFAWSEDPAKNRPCPYKPKTIGVAIDAALDALYLTDGQQVRERMAGNAGASGSARPRPPARSRGKSTTP